MKLGIAMDYEHTYTVCVKFCLQANKYKSTDYVPFLGYIWQSEIKHHDDNANVWYRD
jgi:hypothetical protein